MTTLRVLLARASLTEPSEWALFDPAGRRIDRGRGSASRWPRAERVEAVMAASAVRLVSITLPPLSSSRASTAARYALEDRLATPIENQAVALMPQDASGRVIAAVIDKAVLAQLAQHHPRFSRVLAEPMLAPAPQAWTWYRSGSGGTFVKSPDGSAFAIDMPDPRELPDELVAALRQAMRRGDPVSQVDVAFDVDDATLARWTDALEVPFHRVTAWRWDEAPAAAFATAIDIREHATEPTTESVADRWRWFRPAFALAALALALHVGATFAQWVGLRWQLHRAEQSLMALAREANIPGVTDARSAAAGLATRYAQARHRAGLTAPDDALPLLARAAPALSIIPVEALRGATYSSGAWTFDMAKVDPAVLDRATATLAQSDVTAVEATSGAGVRIRVTP